MDTAFDLTVGALRQQGLNSDEILNELSKLFKKLEGTGEKTASTEDIETKIKKELNAIHMPLNLKGYDYWVQAIRIWKEKGRMKLVEGLYLEVAKIYGTTSTRVERALRHAIKKVFEICPAEIIEAEFGNAVLPGKEKLTTSQFLAIMAEKV